MEKLEAEKLVFVGTLIACSFIVLVFLTTYTSLGKILPEYITIAIGFFVELSMIPCMIFTAAAFLFGVFKLVFQRFNAHVISTVLLAGFTIALVLLNWNS